MNIKYSNKLSMMIYKINWILNFAEKDSRSQYKSDFNQEVPVRY